MQRHSLIASGLILTLFVSLIGCASFEPGLRQQDLLRPRQPTAKATQKGLDVSLEEFVTPSKSMQAFEAVVASYGVLSLLVRLENNSRINFKLPRGNVRAILDGDPLPSLLARDAAMQSASKGYGSNAMAWTLATGPFALLLAPLTLTASSAHTASVNKNIEGHFGTIELPDVLIRQNDAIAGFVYFKLPLATWKLENLVVEIEPIDDDNGDKLSYKFSLPVLDIPIPPEMRDKKPRSED